MWVFMAGVAIGDRYVGKFLKRFATADFLLVALYTCYRGMLACECKISFVMVKLRGRGEGFSAMALCAVIAECFLVVVIVAIDAGCFESEVRFISFF